MEPSRFDEIAFFRAVADSKARAVLIGRRALVLLGLPVLTADYDFWIAIDDIETFNRTAESFDLQPSHPPAEARRRGRDVLENDEHVDVLVAGSIPLADGTTLNFDDVWAGRQDIALAGAAVTLPSLDDLIRTKQVSSRPKDLEDIRLLRVLRDRSHG
jgi:hypothetical protein